MINRVYTTITKIVLWVCHLTNGGAIYTIFTLFALLKILSREISSKFFLYYFSLSLSTFFMLKGHLVLSYNWKPSYLECQFEEIHSFSSLCLRIELILWNSFELFHLARGERAVKEWREGGRRREREYLGQEGILLFWTQTNSRLVWRSGHKHPVCTSIWNVSQDNSNRWKVGSGSDYIKLFLLHRYH